MTSAGLLRFRTQTVKSFQDLWPAVVTIAGRTYPAAAHLGPVLLTSPGEGAIERRGLTACLKKSDLITEPAIGAILVHEDREYIVNSTQGRGPSDPSWRLICIEKDR